MTDGYEQCRQKALEYLSHGDARAAFSAFRRALEFPVVFDDEPHWKDAFGIFARITGPLTNPEFASLVRAVVNNPDDLQSLYDLGFQLIELGLPRIAATVLSRANDLSPDMEVVLTELVCAFEESGLYADACRVLHEVPEVLEESFICRYLLAFNKLMLGNIQAARKILPTLQGDLEPDAKFMASQLEGFLLRADVLSGVSPLDGGDLRGWHFVLNGSILLHLSPWGFDEGMHGRYAYTQDSPSRCLESIKRTQAVLSALDLKPSQVLMIRDRDSEILARATAASLDLPLTPWVTGSNMPGLLPVYDLSLLEGDLVEALRTKRKNQILWCHASNWTEQQPFAADIISYLYQYNHSPWSSRLTLSDSKEPVVRTPAKPGRPEDLSEQIVASEVDEEALSDLSDLQAIARRSKLLTGESSAGIFADEGKRRRQFLQSPVASGRFV